MVMKDRACNVRAYNFSDYFKPKGQSRHIGEETGAFNSEGVSRLDCACSPNENYMSCRYVKAVNGEIIAFVQVISIDGGKSATIANAATRDKHKLQGHAKSLLAKAREDFTSVEHSNDLSVEGKAFAAADKHKKPVIVQFPAFLRM